MNKLLGSLAYLKATWNVESDHFDQFLPFIATIIVNKKYKVIDPAILIQDFPREFGFKVPYHPMMTILQRAKDSGLIKRNAKGKFIPIEDEVVKLDFSSESKLHQERQRALISKLQAFAKESFKIELTPAEAEAGILSLLDNNENELIKYAGGPLDVHINESHKYAAAKFVEHIYTNDHELFRFLADYEIGLALSNSLLHQDLTAYKKFTSGLCCYLDTRFIFRLMGIEGDDRKLYYEDFVATLRTEGALLYVHSHTYDEILGILSECENWVGNTYYDPSKSSHATQYFVNENYSKSDIALFKVMFKTKLESYGINIMESPVYDGNESFLCINEETLYNKIVSNYKERNVLFDEDEKKYTILRDVRSILSILIYRKGRFPSDIGSAGHIFITLNTALAYISKMFYSEANSNNFCIPPCITDTFLGSLVWVNSPAKVSVIYERKIIADCYAALQPSVALLKKFMFELDKLKAHDKITSDDYFMLKTHKTALALLEDKTFGDPDNVTDKTPEEIFGELKEKLKNEERSKLIKEETKHSITKNELDNAKTYIEKITIKANKIANNISNTISAIVLFSLFILFAIGLYASLDSEFLITYHIFRIPLLILYFVLTCLATYYGICIKKIQNSFTLWLSKYILKLML